jgi:hypothetical protein
MKFRLMLSMLLALRPRPPHHRSEPHRRESDGGKTACNTVDLSKL